MNLWKERTMKESSNSGALFWQHQPCNQVGDRHGFESFVSSTAICSSFKIPVMEKENPIPRFRTELNVARKQDNDRRENVRFDCSGSNPMISLTTQKGATFRSRTAVANKTRIKWTENLHKKFVDCVDRLGGAEMATPKAIVKMMNVEGLSILHVKSHLQKYRIGRHNPESIKGKANDKADSTVLDSEVGLQLTETLRQQLDVQRRLKEQLEIQTNLQQRIEEEWKKLRVLFDRQLRRQT